MDFKSRLKSIWKFLLDEYHYWTDIEYQELRNKYRSYQVAKISKHDNQFIDECINKYSFIIFKTDKKEHQIQRKAETYQKLYKLYYYGSEIVLSYFNESNFKYKDKKQLIHDFYANYYSENSTVDGLSFNENDKELLIANIINWWNDFKYLNNKKTAILLGGILFNLKVIETPGKDTRQERLKVWEDLLNDKFYDDSLFKNVVYFESHADKINLLKHIDIVCSLFKEINFQAGLNYIYDIKKIIKTK